MKQFALIFLGLMALGSGAYFWARQSAVCCRHVGVSEAHAHTVLPAERLPELEWLRRELALNEGQFERVRELHLNYLPRCQDMCQKIEEAARRVRDTARVSRGLTPELQAALAAESAVRRECQENLLRHLYATAACMDEAQAQRYLDLIAPAALAPAAIASLP